MKVTRATGTLGFLAAVLLLAGCSGIEDTEPTWLPVPEGGVREYYDLDQFDDLCTPLFVGLTFGQSESVGEKLDLYIGEDDASEENRVVHYDWVIVSQNPAPGEAITTMDGVEVLALPPEEAEKVLENLVPIDPHIDEQRFTGVVTGYGESLNPNIVIVDDAVVDLDLIDPIAANCALHGADVAEATAAKKRLLPVGTEVLVVRSVQGDDHGFIHYWPAVGDEPPAGSVNELLVRTAWWQPADLSFDGGFGINLDWQVASAPYAPAKTVDPGPASTYAPLIAQAGTEAIDARAGGFASCVSTAEADVAASIAYAEETERRIRELEVELENRVTTCRDGDGDGVCHER